MDLEKQKKHQSLKIIVSEAIMVLAVVATVIVLAFIVSGYWINSDFEVERQGMLQVSSAPTGAYVDVDGEVSSWLQRTNTSKVLPSGEHTIALTREGYDSWVKTINIKEGLLYRLHYPRLFLKDRTPEKMLDVSGSTFATISSDHGALVLANNTTKWSYIDLVTDQPKPKDLDVSKSFSSVSLAEEASTGLFTGEIVKADWDYDGNHILFKVRANDRIEWVLLDVRDTAKSINLTKEFNLDFSEVKIVDNSSSVLLATHNHNLHKIDIPSRQISAILVKDVVDFDHFRQEVAFTAKDDEGYYAGYFRIGDDKITELTKFSEPAKILISKFYDDKYLTIMQGSTVKVYLKDGFTEFASYEMSFSPELAKVGHDGEFITMYTGPRIATLDMEAGLIREWSVEGESFDWIDNDMIDTIKDGELIVYDYDGFNRRAIAKNVSAHYPTGITDSRWLYYVSDDNLIREVIRD